METKSPPAPRIANQSSQLLAERDTDFPVSCELKKFLSSKGDVSLSQLLPLGVSGREPELGLPIKQKPLCHLPLGQVEEAEAGGLAQVHLTSWIRVMRRALGDKKLRVVDLAWKSCKASLLPAILAEVWGHVGNIAVSSKGGWVGGEPWGSAGFRRGELESRAVRQPFHHIPAEPRPSEHARAAGICLFPG